METNSHNKRSRLMVDVSPELRRRIKTAAAQRDVSIKQYIVEILEATVPSDREEVVAEGVVTREAFERLGRVRDIIMKGRVFSGDSADLIEESRTERTRELEQAADGKRDSSS